MAIKLIEKKKDIKVMQLKETRKFTKQTMIIPEKTYKDIDKKISSISQAFDIDDINEIVDENYDFKKGNRCKIDVLTDYGWLSGKVFTYENAQSLDVYNHKRDGNSAGVADSSIEVVYAIVVNKY